jgi:hypothetical protein
VQAGLASGELFYEIHYGIIRITFIFTGIGWSAAER